MLKTKIMNSDIENKIEEIDEILASYEDWMHGEDGEDCTKARKLLIDIKEQYLKQQK